MAVARAFVNRPLILLADEPTGNLDPATSQGIMRLLDRINRTGTTVVVATHDAGIVDQMRRRVIELDHGTLVRDQARGVYGMAPAGIGPEEHSRRACTDMPVSLDYVARETASNLWRNRLMTIAAVLTVAVSLSFVGASLLLRQGVAHATTKWAARRQRPHLADPQLSSPQQDSIHQQLTACPMCEPPCTGASSTTTARPAAAPARRVPGAHGGHRAGVVALLLDPHEAQAISHQFNRIPGVKAVASPPSRCTTCSR